MSLTIKGGASSIIIKQVNFDEEANAFLCFENISDDPIFSLGLPFQFVSTPTDQLTEKVYLFTNSLLENKKILKLKLKENTNGNKLVGYIFSLRDLFDSPEIFDNIHLQKVAFNVINKLLSEEDLSLKSKETSYRSDSEYSIFDFYSENLIVAVICDQFVNFQGYSFKNYLPAFSKYGFRLAPNCNFSPPNTDCQVIIDNYQDITSSLTLKIPNNNLNRNYFINSLIHNELFLIDNEVARFHLYYQVIEMLLEKVYKNEVSKRIISKFNSLSSFDAKELFRETMRDAYSLSKIFGGAYSKIDTNIVDELKTHVDVFLNYVGISDPPVETYSKVYKVRNTLFHGYSKILENEYLDLIKVERYLKHVNDSFEYFIMDIILSYTPPSV